MRVLMIAAAALILPLSACSKSANGQETAQITSAADLPAGNWTINKNASTLGFSGTQKGSVFSGEFKAYDASINFDPDNLPASKVIVIVDMKSAQSGDEERDSSLPGAEWFAVGLYPTATFKSSDITKIANESNGARYMAKGELTIKETTLPVQMPFSLSIDGNTATMSGSLELDRTSYQVGTGVWSKGEWVDKAVKVNVQISATKS